MSGPAAVAGLVFHILGRRRPSESSEVAGSAAGLQSAADPGGRDRSVPRWLDPALAAARRPDRSPAVAPGARAPIARARAPMVFVTPGEELAGLHHVRYDGVPLLDRPDDVLGRLMQELDGGDEVNVLERAEIWTQVRTPNNLVGWVPSMTLVAVSAAAAEEVPAPPVAIDLDPAAEAEEPIALEALFEAIAAQRMAMRLPQPVVEAAPSSPRRRARTSKAEAPSTPTRRREQRAKATPEESRSRCDRPALAKVTDPGAERGSGRRQREVAPAARLVGLAPPTFAATRSSGPAAVAASLTWNTASSPHTVQIAVSLSTRSASAMREGSGSNGRPSNVTSSPATMTTMPRSASRPITGTRRPEELRLVDRDHVGAVRDGRLDLVGARRGQRREVGARVRGEAIGAVPRVEGVVEHDDPAARDRRAPDAPQQLLGLAREHRPADHLDPTRLAHASEDRTSADTRSRAHAGTPPRLRPGGVL